MAHRMVGTLISVIGKSLANSCWRHYFQTVLFLSVKSPERVLKVGFLAQNVVWMVCMVYIRFGHLCPPMNISA